MKSRFQKNCCYFCCVIEFIILSNDSYKTHLKNAYYSFYVNSMNVVANMYVAAKLYRTKKKFKKDTYVDAANYLYQAEEMHKQEEEIFNTQGIVKDQVDG